MEIDRNALKIPSNAKFPDIVFHKSSAIDMLVSAKFFFELLEAEKIEFGENRPLLHNTNLGWVIAGSIALNHATSLTCTRSTIATINCSLEHFETLNKNLERFWGNRNCKIRDKSNASWCDCHFARIRVSCVDRERLRVGD